MASVLLTGVRSWGVQTSGTGSTGAGGVMVVGGGHVGARGHVGVGGAGGHVGVGRVGGMMHGAQVGGVEGAGVISASVFWELLTKHGSLSQRHSEGLE
jgi:hypothetical protein